jgi:hypothetical protein
MKAKWLVSLVFAFVLSFGWLLAKADDLPKTLISTRSLPSP